MPLIWDPMLLPKGSLSEPPLRDPGVCVSEGACKITHAQGLPWAMYTARMKRFRLVDSRV